MPNVPTNPSQQYGANTSPSKKEYTSDEILKNFIAVNEELKQKGYSYYQLPSMQISQIWLDGKLTSYYPDSANIVYPMTEGPKGSITDYKNPNFDEALLRKYTDAKSLSDQYQQKVSLGVRSALASASDPSKVSVATVIAQVNSSVDSGAGRGITLSFVSPQATATSLNIQSELKRAGANLDSLSAGAVKNNDASSIIALHNKFMAASDTTKPLTGFPAGVNPSIGGQLYGAQNMAAQKKEYTPAEIRDNFIAVNEELKKNGFTYYQLPSASMMQIWDNGKLVPYYPDMANMAYPATVGPKGSITDYKNPNFDETLMRKYTDAKSLSDQLQQKISSAVRGAMATATDPSKVNVSAIVTGIYSSTNTGGKGITLSSNDPQKTASSMKISSELRRPGSVDTDSLSVEAVRNNDADSIVALRKKYTGGAIPTNQFGGIPTVLGGQGSQIGVGQAGNPTTGPVYTPGSTGAGDNTGLNPASDESKYLQAKQESQHVGFSSPKIEDTATGLAGAWSQFKSDNEKLKAEGYDYQEVKPGFYGKPVVSTDSFLTRVSGPNGDIVSATGSLSSELKDIRVRAKGPASLYDASQQFSAEQKVDELSKVLIAKGVDIAKLEQDNPQGALASTTDRWSDFIATHPSTTPDQLRGILARNYLTIKSMDDRTPEQRVDDAWSDYKSSNEKLKAAGYSYDPILDDNNMEPGVLVAGKNGMIWDKPGFSLQLDEASQDKSNPDFKLSSDHFVAQSNLASTKYSLDMYNDISSRLSADGVNLTQLENENPNFYRNSLSNTTGKDIFNSSSLGSLVNSEDTEIMSANAAKNILGTPDRQRGGGVGGNLLQTNATNQQQIYDPMALAQQQISTAIASGMEKLDAQNKAIAAGTWKPSDGYYFTTNYEPYSLAFDPTGQMKDYVPVGDNDWLKAHGYDYYDASTDKLVYGPKGNGGSFETDQSKKGEAQLINEQKWAELGVNLVGEPDRFGNERYGSAIENMNWSQQATKIIADPINNPKNKPGLVDTSWLKPNGLTLEQAQAKAASLVNPVDGTPKPGVTQEMIAQAAKDVYISSGKLKVVNGMVVNTTNQITSDPMQSDMLPSPEWLKKMGYVVGTGGVDDVLGADGKMYSIQFPSEIAKANNTASALAAATAATQSSKVLAGGAVIDKRIAEITASGASQAVKDKALTEIKSGNPSSSADLIKWFGAGGGASVASTDPRTTAILNSSASQWVKDQAIAEINKGNTSDANALMAWFKPHDPTPAVAPGSPTVTPYSVTAQPTVIMPTTAVQPVAPATITLTDKNNVSRTVAINSPEAIHVGSGGTYQDLDTVSAIYSRGDPTEIANWEKFSGSKPPAGGYTATNSANPYTPASTVAFTANNGQNPIYP